MKKVSIVLLFSRGSPFVHECLANFRSLFAHLWFLIKTTRNRKIFAQNCDFFIILDTSLPYWFKMLSGGQLLIFGQF